MRVSTSASADAPSIVNTSASARGQQTEPSSLGAIAEGEGEGAGEGKRKEKAGEVCGRTSNSPLFSFYRSRSKNRHGTSTLSPGVLYSI
eukprot:scaffold325985_cov61-Tisochrysis_lutea.AAC.1